MIHTKVCSLINIAKPNLPVNVYLYFYDKDQHLYINMLVTMHLSFMCVTLINIHASSVAFVKLNTKFKRTGTRRERERERENLNRLV